MNDKPKRFELPAEYKLGSHIKAECVGCSEKIEGNTQQILTSGWKRAYGEWWCQECSDNMP